MIFTLLILLLLFAAIFAFIESARFGKAPNASQIDQFKKSPNYKDGKFQNLSYTPQLSEGYSMLGIMRDMLFNPHPDRKPKSQVPSVKTDLKSLAADEEALIWFGHSSYFLKTAGKTFLVDPVLSGNASPLPTTKAFNGSDIFKLEDIPTIDFLLISHDHYDHLDYQTIKGLKTRVGKVICGLGVSSHLLRWGYHQNQIIELDWYDSFQLNNEMTIWATPARHFSGRKLVRNNTLWLSFVLQTPNHKLFLGGDSGYDTHFKEIGNRFGPFDLAVLENGQYNLAWHAIHMLPEETLQAACDLKAKRLLPIHHAKFTLALHSWDEPLKEIEKLKTAYDVDVINPMIGEKVLLNESEQKFAKWWT